MAKYTVYLYSTLSTSVNVDAEDPDEAIDLAYESPEMPGSMGFRAFGRASVDCSNVWEPSSVVDENGKTVWSEG